MKLALFHNLPTGGAKRLLYDIIKEFIRGKSKIDVYSYPRFYDSVLESPLMVSPNKYVDLPWLTPKSPPEYLEYVLLNKYKRLCRELSKKIDRQGYDWAILAGDWITHTSTLSNFLSTPCLLLAHELKREFYEKTEWGLHKIIKQSLWKSLTLKIKKMEIENLNNAELIVVNSLFSWRKFEKVVVDRNKLELIYPFIDPKFLYNTHKDFQDRDNFFLSVGSFSLLKGYDFLIQAISMLPLNVRFPLYLVGSEGPHIEKILRLSKNLNVTVVIKSAIPDTELRNLYKKSKAFFFFPRSEPFGLAALEALSMNCKVFAVNEGGFTELTKKSENCTLLPRNLKIFTRELRDYLQNSSIASDVNYINMIKNKYNVKHYVDKLMGVMRK